VPATRLADPYAPLSAAEAEPGGFRSLKALTAVRVRPLTGDPTDARHGEAR
jgi:hypothetical protein